MVDAGELARPYLEQSPNCNWIWSADGTFIAIYNDPLEIFGAPAARLTGCRLSDVLDPKTVGRWKDRLSRAIGGEALAIREWSGNKSWNIAAFPIRSAAGDIRFAGFQTRGASGNATERQLRDAVLQALRKQEQERNCIARFLHDTIGQNITALGLQLDLLSMDLKSVAPEACERIAAIQRALEPMMAQVREHTYDLNPSNVERAGLRSALDRLAVRGQCGFTGSIRTYVDPSVHLAPAVAAAAYRIVEEAVANAIKHSHCSMIEIAVRSIHTGTILEVRDNGTGFDPGRLGEGYPGLGLPGMEYYAAEAGLVLSIESHRGAGTVVRAEARKSEIGELRV